MWIKWIGDIWSMCCSLFCYFCWYILLVTVVALDTLKFSRCSPKLRLCLLTSLVSCQRQCQYHLQGLLGSTMPLDCKAHRGKHRGIYIYNILYIPSFSCHWWFSYRKFMGNVCGVSSFYFVFTISFFFLEFFLLFFLVIFKIIFKGQKEVSWIVPC